MILSFIVYDFFFALKFSEKQLAFQGLLILGKTYSEVQKLLFFVLKKIYSELLLKIPERNGTAL